MASEQFVADVRARISENDLKILEAVNQRLKLVDELWAHKREHGLPMVDGGREHALLRSLVEANPGPLSEEGVRELFSTILDLTKREVS